MACQRDYELTLGNCNTVENVISNCEYYGEANNCLTCEKGYILNNQGNQCLVNNPNIQNCLY